MKHLFTLLLVIFILNVSAQNSNVSNLATFEGEPYIAINPTNNNNIIVAWMGFVVGNGTGLTIKVKSSFNGGVTWSNAVNLPHLSPNFKSADVSMAFDGNGTAFLSYIDYREAPDSGAVYLTKSTNGGTTWSTPISVITAQADGTKTPIDRPWIAIDNAGNTIYITTKPAPWKPAPNRPYFISSNNGGVSFKTWRYIDTTNYLVGNVIAAPMATPAIAGSTLIAAYPSYLASQSVFPRYLLAKSINGGNTFTYTTILNQTSNAAFNDSAKANYKLLANPTNNNHYVFIIIGSVSGNDLDVLLTESFDAGNTWSAVKRINDDAQSNGKMQDLMWSSFDVNGNLALTWRDRRNAIGTGYAKASEIYGTYRVNGTTAFLPNFKISNVLENYTNLLAKSGNDVMCMELNNDTIHATWGSTRDGSLDIWYAKIYAKTGNVTSTNLIDSEALQIATFPNPTHDILNIALTNNALMNGIELYDLAGKLIYTASACNINKTSINVANLAKGTYTLTIKKESNYLTKKIIVN
jgi:hypothetical protein